MKKILFAFCIFVLLSGKSFAQFYVGTDLSYMTLQHSTYMSNVNLINSNSEYYASQRHHEENAAPANSKSFLFVPKTQTSTKVKQSIIDHAKKKDPNSLLGEALNDQNNPYPKYVKLLKSLGLDVERDYADAFTAYMLGMWRIANKMSANPSKQQIQYVRKQILSVMDVRQWTNTEKQEATEYLMYNLIFANEPYEYSRLSRNQKQWQEDADAVQKRFLRENNMNLRKMTISENGLTQKR